MDAIHSAGVLGWIEQPNISLVHVQIGEPSIGNSGSQDGAGVFVILDGDDWFVSKNEICK